MQVHAVEIESFNLGEDIRALGFHGPELYLEGPCALASTAVALYKAVFKFKIQETPKSTDGAFASVPVFLNFEDAH